MHTAERWQGMQCKPFGAAKIQRGGATTAAPNDLCVYVATTVPPGDTNGPSPEGNAWMPNYRYVGAFFFCFDVGLSSLVAGGSYDAQHRFRALLMKCYWNIAHREDIR